MPVEARVLHSERTEVLEREPRAVVSTLHACWELDLGLLHSVTLCSVTWWRALLTAEPFLKPRPPVLILDCIYFYMCVYVFTCACRPQTCVQRSVDSVQELAPSFYHVGHGMGLKLFGLITDSRGGIWLAPWFLYW